MKHRLFVYLVVVCFSLSLRGEDNASPTSTKSSSNQAAPEHLEPSNFTSAKGFVLEDGTPMRLRFNRTISSADAHVGDTVDFEVLQDISVNRVLVIPKGSLAFGTVTEAQPKRRMARGGKLEINLDYVKLVDDQKAAVRAVQGGNGGGHTGLMTAGIVATGLVFFPAAPFFLFMHGKDITLPKGAEVTAYVNGDVKMDIAKFPPVASPAPAVASNSETSANAKVQIDSSPPGADIDVDGAFVGNTPSEVQIQEGEHLVTVQKAGFKNWERKLKINSGSNVHLTADLETTATATQ